MASGEWVRCERQSEKNRATENEIGQLLTSITISNGTVDIPCKERERTAGQIVKKKIRRTRGGRR